MGARGEGRGKKHWPNCIREKKDQASRRNFFFPTSLARGAWRKTREVGFFVKVTKEGDLIENGSSCLSSYANAFATCIIRKHTLMYIRSCKANECSFTRPSGRDITSRAHTCFSHSFLLHAKKHAYICAVCCIGCTNASCTRSSCRDDCASLRTILKKAQIPSFSHLCVNESIQPAYASQRLLTRPDKHKQPQHHKKRAQGTGCRGLG
jgi:hypothetical protein